MANHYRGQAEITIAGKPYQVAFTMDALGLLADKFDLKTWEDVGNKLKSASIPEMKAIVALFLKGNGHDVPDSDLGKMEIWEYFDRLLPGMFNRNKPEAGGDKARPPKR